MVPPKEFCTVWSPDQKEPLVFRHAGLSTSHEWLRVLQTFPDWFQAKTAGEIRKILGGELREEDSICSVTLGWNGNTMGRIVTLDRQLMQIAIGIGDFGTHVMSDDVDSGIPADWDSLISERQAIDSLLRIGIRIRFPEDITDQAKKAMERCPKEPVHSPASGSFLNSVKRLLSFRFAKD